MGTAIADAVAAAPRRHPETRPAHANIAGKAR
jgi:hypothetical protein